ncbi:MAG: TIGR02996 domain-containing protein [Myxococcota bacterium]
MMDGKTLEDAIRANPDDDALRLVYADWLADQGDMSHAAFIESDVTAARHPATDPRGLPAKRRRNRLWRRHRSEWKAKLPKLSGVVWGDHYERGLLSHAEVQSFALFTQRHGPALAEHTHLTSVQVPWPIQSGAVMGTVPSTLRRLELVTKGFNSPRAGRLLAQAPWLNQIREIEVRGSASHLPDLLASPFLGQLDRLSLEGVRLDEGRLADILALIPRGLRALRLYAAREHTATRPGWREERAGPPLQASHLQCLLDWPGLTDVTSLNVGSNSASEAVATALIGSPKLASIEHLALPYVEGGFPFAAEGVLRPHTIRLSRNAMEDRNAEEFVDSSWLGEVHELDTAGSPTNPGALRTLTNAPFTKGLRCWWNYEGTLDNLARHFTLPNLHALSLTTQERGNAPGLQHHQGLTGVRYLALRGRPRVLRHANLPTLEWLELDISPDDPILQTLRQAAWFPQLEANGGIDLL